VSYVLAIFLAVSASASSDVTDEAIPFSLDTNENMSAVPQKLTPVSMHSSMHTAEDAHVPVLDTEENKNDVASKDPFHHMVEIHRKAALHIAGMADPNELSSPRDIILSPSFGPTSGGVWVQVTGAGSFHTPNSLQCKLDLVEQYCYSNHYFYSWCYVTPKCAGVFPFTCHNGPLNFQGKYAVISKVPWVTSVYPFSGDVSGGTPITVRGWNFEPHCPRLLLCRFGEKVVRAKYYTSSSVMCIAPCSMEKGFVSVEVSNDGGSHWSMSGVQFGYVGSSLTASQMALCSKYLAPDQSVALDTAPLDNVRPLHLEQS